jgi:hypothetical protein
MLLKITDKRDSNNLHAKKFNVDNAFCQCPDCLSSKQTSEERTRFCDFDTSTIIANEVSGICASCYHEKDVKCLHLYHFKTGYSHNQHKIFPEDQPPLRDHLKAERTTGGSPADGCIGWETRAGSEGEGSTFSFKASMLQGVES